MDNLLYDNDSDKSILKNYVVKIQQNIVYFMKEIISKFLSYISLTL